MTARENTITRASLSPKAEKGVGNLEVGRYGRGVSIFFFSGQVRHLSCKTRAVVARYPQARVRPASVGYNAAI